MLYQKFTVDTSGREGVEMTREGIALDLLTSMLSDHGYVINAQKMGTYPERLVREAFRIADHFLEVAREGREGVSTQGFPS